MKMYRVKFIISETRYIFITPADDCRQAVGKLFLAANKEELFGSDTIILCRKVLAGAIENENDMLIYDSEELKIECSKSIAIEVTTPGYNLDDSALNTYRNLPDNIARKFDEYEVLYVLTLKLQYLEENGFLRSDAHGTYIAEETETGDIYDPEAVVEFIEKEAAVDDIFGFTTEQIETILAAELEYIESCVTSGKETIRPTDVIDFSKLIIN
jgi:hypothetical protein